MIGESNGTVIPGPQALVAPLYQGIDIPSNQSAYAANRDYWDLRDCNLAPRLETIKLTIVYRQSSLPILHKLHLNLHLHKQYHLA